MWKCDVTACANDVIDDAVKIKVNTGDKINEKIDVTSFSNLSGVKAKLTGVKKSRFCFLYIQNISVLPEDPIATGKISAISDFSTDCFAYWRSIREVYRVIDRLHVTGLIQSVFDILVRGKIIFYILTVYGE